MPKSTTSTSKVTKLKQGKLDFSAKRATTGAKVKGSTIKSAASSAKGSKSSTPIDVDSSDDTEDHDTTPKARKIKSAARPAAKRRKIDSNAALSGETDEGILKLRDGVKNSGGGRPVQEEKMPPLHPNDKKWAKLYREASAKMGHIEPVHSKGLNKVHHILRVFDLSYEFGPCVGVSRLQRWERAATLGLNPPPEIKEILTTRDGIEKEEYSQCVFYGDL